MVCKLNQRVQILRVFSSSVLKWCLKIAILGSKRKNKEGRHKGRWWTFVNLVLTNTDAIRSSLCFRRDRFCFAILGAIEKPVSCRNNKLAFEYNKPCLHWDPPNPKHLKQLAKQEHTEENIKPAKSFRQNILLAGELHFWDESVCLQINYFPNLYPVDFLDVIESQALTPMIL